MEKCWPVPCSHSHETPKNGTRGAFWEYRKDRYHCGIDISAPTNSPVMAIENGTVIGTGEFSSPEILPYWNQTYFILIKNEDSRISKYAELGKIFVETGEEVKTGQLIGLVGQVLNQDKIDASSPEYVQILKMNHNCSMLHFELYETMPMDCKKYLGGNWFDNRRPIGLLDPTEYLEFEYCHEEKHHGNQK